MATKCDWNYYDKHGTMYTCEEIEEMGEEAPIGTHIKVNKDSVNAMDQESFDELIEAVKEVLYIS